MIWESVCVFFEDYFIEGILYIKMYVFNIYNMMGLNIGYKILMFIIF